MSRDPYHDFARDLRASLSNASSLAASYSRIRSSLPARDRTGSDELRRAQDELAEALEALETDIEDVRESVKAVQKAGPERFGVDHEELERRKRFVSDCEKEIDVSRGLGAVPFIVKAKDPDFPIRFIFSHGHPTAITRSSDNFRS